MYSTVFYSFLSVCREPSWLYGTNSHSNHKVSDNPNFLIYTQMLIPVHKGDHASYLGPITSKLVMPLNLSIDENFYLIPVCLSIRD